MTDLGPFSVHPGQIADLGANFTAFINQLLIVEIARADMDGIALETSYLYNIGDKGVDAVSRADSNTSWIPKGETAWQFKAGDLSPGKCKTELEGASFALDVLRSGGKYRLVLGKSHPSSKIKDRLDKLTEAAVGKGVVLNDDSIKVLTADSLARWTEENPSLAISPLLPGVSISNIAVPFGGWAQSQKHASIWVPSAERDDKIAQIRGLMNGSEALDVHVEGVSGLGKSRLVMEAVRAQPFESLVVFIQSADFAVGSMINHLASKGRTAIVIVDECGRRQHESYAERLQIGSKIRLITMGEPDLDMRVTSSPVIEPEKLDEEAMKRVLQTNASNLWPEAVRVIVENVNGNVKYALVSAQAITRNPNLSAATLITAGHIRTYITDALPSGALFLACSVLALFTRVGFDSDVAPQLELISAPFGLTAAQLVEASRALDQQGLLTKQGRFRSVSPHPLAVYLATRAWKEFGDTIVNELLPKLPDDLAQKLFIRAADIGDFGATRTAVRRLLAGDGPFSSLETIAVDSNSKLLVQFAILAPEEVVARLHDLIEAAPLDDLREQTSIRRNLVNALAKLAWHSRTFEEAADALLRLSNAENETWGNNATGTWVELFGARLPGTAAPSRERSAYLRQKAESGDEAVKTLVARAAPRAFGLHETIMVSAEIQGGVVVEPRGGPATYGDLWDYEMAAIDTLRFLRNDSSASVRELALEGLVSAIPPILSDFNVRDHLFEVLATLDEAGLQSVRMEMLSLHSLFDLVDDAADRQAGLDLLSSRIPIANAEQALWAIARSRRWDFEEGALERDLLEAARHIDESRVSDVLFSLLSETVSTAFEIGVVLASLWPGAVPTELVALVDGPNSPALVGYLWSEVRAGRLDAFDLCLDGPIGSTFSSLTRVQLTVRGPQTGAAYARLDGLIPTISVRDGVQSLFGWQRELGEDRLDLYLGQWLERIADQEDYNALGGLLSLLLHPQVGALGVTDELVARYVFRRRDFPSVGQQSWEWAQLANRQLEFRSAELLALLLDLIENDGVAAYESSEENRLLREAVAAAGPSGWTSYMDRLLEHSWRLQLPAKGWLAGSTDVATVQTWIDGDVERARVVASVASIGSTSVDPVASLLLDNFGSDSQVSSSVVGEFVSGMWTGNESSAIATQMAQVELLISDHSNSDAVRTWARELLRYLRSRLEAVAQHEAEEDWS